ncbi:hypothetical protein [Cyanobium sp. CH-040]|uniref:hypothetical protein n=1 Tax=Cyanobium sp. CH-040 TaxID=2823708 RepID=UPI0020CEFAD5|nr:hypothetical protein [Cyanobium sp. CH-040]MCP9928055.1 hypothetical protein [Cyanobium sp. CH-040]
MSRPSQAEVLQPLVLRFRRAPGPLLPQIQAALAAHGEPLRWAITAVRGEELCLEAVMLTASPVP